MTAAEFVSEMEAVRYRFHVVVTDDGRRCLYIGEPDDPLPMGWKREIELLQAIGRDRLWEVSNFLLQREFGR
jgi:hypothetical protein